MKIIYSPSKTNNKPSFYRGRVFILKCDSHNCKNIFAVTESDFDNPKKSGIKTNWRSKSYFVPSPCCKKEIFLNGSSKNSSITEYQFKSTHNKIFRNIKSKNSDNTRDFVGDELLKMHLKSSTSSKFAHLFEDHIAVAIKNDLRHTEYEIYRIQYSLGEDIGEKSTKDNGALSLVEGAYGKLSLVDESSSEEPFYHINKNNEKTPLSKKHKYYIYSGRGLILLICIEIILLFMRI